MFLSKRLNFLQEYIFFNLSKKIEEVEKKSGREVLNLGVGSPYYQPYRSYISKLEEYIKD